MIDKQWMDVNMIDTAMDLIVTTTTTKLMLYVKINLCIKS